MKLNNQLPLQRLIGKIDNDFNIDHSDWIPRVAAWVTDALSQLKLLPMECKTRELEVVDRIATFPCDIDASSLTVYDSNGCPLDEANSDNGCGCGCGSQQLTNKKTTSTPVEEIAILVDEPNDIAAVYGSTVATLNRGGGTNKNFVFIKPNKIELNYDTDSITVKTREVATYYDEYFDDNVPYVYDNGVLLEALAWYCLFKILSRGYKHQVFSLTSQNQVLNPFVQWSQLKDKAYSSVKNDLRKKTGNAEGWNNFFFNSTFRPRG